MTPDLLVGEVLLEIVDDIIPGGTELGPREGVDVLAGVVVVVTVEHSESPISHLVSATV